ncbi:MAG: ATP-binding protein [Bacteroidales bacterium]|nr:ATP-binding protein [Bacteroidales bacterium]
MNSYKFILTLTLLLPSLAVFADSKNVRRSEVLGGVKIVDVNSLPTVYAVTGDADGMMWMISDKKGVISSDGRTYVNYLPDSTNVSSLSTKITTTIFSDRNNNIWVGTQKGVDVLDSSRLSFHHYTFEGRNNYINGIAEDKDGKVFVWTIRDLYEYNPEKDEFDCRISFGDNVVRPSTLTVDNRGGVWIAFGESLLHYDSEYQYVDQLSLEGNISKIIANGSDKLYVIHDGRLSQVNIFDSKVEKLSRTLSPLENKHISTASRSRQYIVFVTDDEVFCYDLYMDYLYSSSDNDLPISIPTDQNSIRSVTGDCWGNFWFTTYDENLYRSTSIENEDPFAVLMARLGTRQLASSAFDKDFIWFLTKNFDLVTYNLKSKRIVSDISLSDYLKLDVGFNPYYSSGLSASNDGSLVVSISSGVYVLKMSPEGQLAETVHVSSDKNSQTIMVTSQSPDGGIWSAGLGPKVYYAHNDGSSKLQFRQVVTISGESQMHASAICALRSGQVAVSFSDLGTVIIDPKDYSYRIIKMPKDFPQIFISSLYEDSDGYLWISSSDWGLFRYDPFKDNTIQIGQFEDSSVWKVFGLEGSMYVFDGKTLYRYDKASEKFIQIWSDASDIPSDINLFPLPGGSMIYESSGHYGDILLQQKMQDGFISRPLHAIVSSGKEVISTFMATDDAGKHHIRLKTMPRDLVLTLSLMDQNYYPVAYNFQLNGKSDQFVVSGQFPVYGIHYGRNLLKFRAVNLNTSVEGPEYVLVIGIPHPISHVLIWLVLFALLTSLVIAINQRRKTLAQVAKERSEKQLQEKINMANIDFFANISHEFRTPLTLISSAVDNMSSEETASGQRKMRQIIKRNTDRMLKLVSQMLDFNKLDHDMLRLDVSMKDACELVPKIVEQFKFSASVKDITLENIQQDSSALLWLDSDKLEKVMYNLLSNAMKFTAPGGTISVSMQIRNLDDIVSEFDINPEEAHSDNFLRITVADTGVGIPEGSLTYIFDRFAQISAEQKKQGTGIGLYYTKSLIELHHGRIYAANRTDLPSGKTGSVFSFFIPMDESAYSEQEKNRVADTYVSVDSNEHPSEYLESVDATIAGKKKVLVIDDDYEIVYMLKSLLSPSYQVICRFDAMSGYQVAQEELPELIICDVMMVDTDGLQFCRMVKENIDISHIPVILLTAKSTVEDQIGGLNAGAEAYVIKPYSNEYLMAIVKSLIDNRDRAKNLFGNITESRKIDKDMLSEMDRVLMDRLYPLMESCLKQGELNIDDIASQLGMSRTKFYAKIKSLTGQTPNDFFNVYKVNRAAELIKEGKLKISVISEMVGFSSASHFAKVFKKRFGVLPSQYIGGLDTE